MVSLGFSPPLGGFVVAAAVDGVGALVVFALAWGLGAVIPGAGAAEALDSVVEALSAGCMIGP